MIDELGFSEFCWNDLATPDIPKAKNFYKKLFAWDLVDHQMDGMTYTLIKHRDKEIGSMWLIPKEKQKEIPPHWLAYVLVENLDISLEKAINNGASVTKPATNVGNFGRFAIIQDPVGAHIALWQNLLSETK